MHFEECIFRSTGGFQANRNSCHKLQNHVESACARLTGGTEDGVIPTYTLEED